MKRIIYKNLLDWKTSKIRAPLLLKGARQVGKSYILEAFGRHEFRKSHLFNFEKEKQLSSVFEPDLNPERILTELSIYSGKKVDITKDLVIFDEIQECPAALTALKYFCEDMPRLALCCAGSLIGVKVSSESFPVGKVDFLNLYPLTFEEFLMAMDDKMSLELYRNAEDVDSHSEIVHQRLWNRLREYYVTGGMPAVVLAYTSHRHDTLDAMQKARHIQKKLVESYTYDFAKHSGKINSVHISSVFENVPMQLSANIDGSVKRYRFKGVIPKKRGYAELRGPMEWLEKSGLVLKVKVCKKAQLPLESFCNHNMFKLFMFDIGLLGCMLDLPVKLLYAQDFGISKGYLAENLVAQEFAARGVENLYSWVGRTAEIEFLRVMSGELIPVEVKSGTRTQAKSLRQYILNYSPTRAVKLSGRPLYKGREQTVQNYPLYLAAKI
jgi:uncharacterized protein